MLASGGSALSADFALARDGTLFYTKLAPFTYRATWVDRAGRATPMRAGLAGQHQGLSISPDGSGVAMAIDDDVWFVPFDNAPPLRLTTGGIAGTGRVAWTPDGHTLYLIGYREGRFSTVLRVPVRDGGQAEEVALHDSRQMFGTAVSPDGRWLLFRTDNQASGAGDILGLRLGIDTVPRVLVASKYEDLSPAISPDGRWMAYSSNESGRHEIYVRPFPETSVAKFQVSLDGGTEPRWSRTGRELFYHSARGKLVSVPVVPGPTFVKGAPVDLFDVTGYAASVYSQSYDVSADGKRFLMLHVVGDPRPEAVVVFNFLEELKAAFGRGGR
jgi:serine/threonine-protein kinase